MVHGPNACEEVSLSEAEELLGCARRVRVGTGYDGTQYIDVRA